MPGNSRLEFPLLEIILIDRMGQNPDSLDKVKQFPISTQRVCSGNSGMLAPHGVEHFYLDIT